MKDLEEIFVMLDRYQMKLSLTKVSNKGIEPNPKKVQAILDMPQLVCIQDVQRLMRRIIALDQFMLKS